MIKEPKYESENLFIRVGGFVKEKSKDLYVNPEDLIENIINTRTKLQNVQNDKSHRLSLSAFVLKEAEKAAAWMIRER